MEATKKKQSKTNKKKKKREEQGEKRPAIRTVLIVPPTSALILFGITDFLQFFPRVLLIIASVKNGNLSTEHHNNQEVILVWKCCPLLPSVEDRQ